MTEKNVMISYWYLFKTELEREIFYLERFRTFKSLFIKMQITAEMTAKCINIQAHELDIQFLDEHAIGTKLSNLSIVDDWLFNTREKIVNNTKKQR